MKQGLWRSAPLRWIVVGVGLLAVLLALVLGGRHNGPIAHPVGVHDIVIQLQTGGGMEPRLEAMADTFPVLTLYGDGTLIYHMSGAYQQTRLDEAAMQRLLHVALDDVAFFNLPSSLADVEVYDAPGTSVTVNADGRAHAVSAMALGFGDDAGHDDQRSRLLQLVQALGALEDDQAPAYVPAAVRLYAEPAGTTGATPALPAWPVAGVDLAAVLAGQGSDGSGFRLTGDAAAAGLRAAASPAVFTQTGQSYRVVAV